MREMRLVPWTLPFQGPVNLPEERPPTGRELLESILNLLGQIEDWDDDLLTEHASRLADAEDALIQIVLVGECEYPTYGEALCLRDTLPGSNRCSRHQGT